MVGFEINERLRLTDLIEERPFAYLFHGEVMALSRVVGTCSVTLFRPSARTAPSDLAESLRAASRSLQGEFLFGLQQIEVVRHGDLSGFLYATGEPVSTTLSLEIAQGRFMGYEDGERIICNVARALLSYHDENRTHGRIRPYHLLKTPQGWKLAGHEMVEVEDRLDRLRRAPEEPVYLPPENYRQGDYGPAVDLWALGVCTHQAACGRIPYSTDSDLIEQLLKNPPRVEKPPGRFGSVVRALLSQDPEERWPLRRCIDHIERPRDNDFRGVGGAGSAPLTPTLPVLPSLPPAPVAPRRPRPLYLRPGFLFFALVVFVVAAALGWQTAKLPPVPRYNAPPSPLYAVSFQQAELDADGRRVTRRPEQAIAFSEALGGGHRLEMVQVRPGAFEMGSSNNEPYGEKSERPSHRVQVSGFFMSRFEITQQQWDAVAAAPRVQIDLPRQPSSFKGPDRPVEGVTWLEAREFCARLSRMSGRLYRLPTEAEWEFACRAGTPTPFSFGPTILSSLANYQADRPYAQEGVGEYRRQTVAVGSLDAANAFGLSDMHGNVAEWCDDLFGEYSSEAQVDPLGPSQGRDRVVRGGGWRSYPWQCRSASRVGLHETHHRNDIGFRVVLPEVVMVENPRN